MHLRDYLDEVKKKTGMTKREFAASLNITPIYLNKIQQGGRPSIRLATAIAEKSDGNVSVNDLLYPEKAERTYQLLKEKTA